MAYLIQKCVPLKNYIRPRSSNVLISFYWWCQQAPGATSTWNAMLSHTYSYNVYCKCKIDKQSSKTTKYKCMLCSVTTLKLPSTKLCSTLYVMFSHDSYIVLSLWFCNFLLIKLFWYKKNSGRSFGYWQYLFHKYVILKKKKQS